MSPVRLRVRELREAKGWTQYDLAEKAALRQATISAIEGGRTRRIDFDVLDRLARALGVDAAFLLVTESDRRRGR